MILRVVKVDEYQFLLCLKNGLWGSNTNSFKKWNVGDYIIFTVNKQLTALAEVIGEPFVSNDVIWDNGLFPNRIGIKYTHILSTDDRIDMKGEIRELFYNSWGYNYGWGILNQTPMLDDDAQQLVNAISSKPNSLRKYTMDLDNLLCISEKERELERRNFLSGELPPFTRKYKNKNIDLSNS